MTTRNHDIGVVLTSAALLRVMRVARAMPDLDFRDGMPGTEEAVLAGLGDQWVDTACAIYKVTKDQQSTQDVIAAALNRAARRAREAR